MLSALIEKYIRAVTALMYWGTSCSKQSDRDFQRFCKP